MNAWWAEVGATLESEFSDITDAAQLTRVCVRLLIAALLGGLLGFEREMQHKAAGVRTHMLVAMGAALFVLIPNMLGADESTLSRIVQGVVTGIGFLGAGTILKGQGDNLAHVKGLTTAAGLWMTAAIGVAAGCGREATALLSTILALLIFTVMPRVVARFEKIDRLQRIARFEKLDRFKKVAATDAVIPAENLEPLAKSMRFETPPANENPTPKS